MENESEKIDVKKLIKKLSKRYNKKEKIISCMVEILKKEDYSLDEFEKSIMEFIEF